MVSIFGVAKRGFGMLKKKKKTEIRGRPPSGFKAPLLREIRKKKGKEWDILKKNPRLAKQKYSDSAVNKMLTKDFKKKKSD